MCIDENAEYSTPNGAVEQYPAHEPGLFIGNRKRLFTDERYPLSFRLHCVSKMLTMGLRHPMHWRSGVRPDYRGLVYITKPEGVRSFLDAFWNHHLYEEEYFRRPCDCPTMVNDSPPHLDQEIVTLKEILLIVLKQTKRRMYIVCYLTGEPYATGCDSGHSWSHVLVNNFLRVICNHW